MYTTMFSLGLGECFRQVRASPSAAPERAPAGKPDPIGAIVFGSDQGLVGPFNDLIADHAIDTLAGLPGRAQVWAVGERVEARLKEVGLDLLGVYAVPGSVDAIALLVAQIQIDSEASHAQGDPNQVWQVHVFLNRLDHGATTLRALIREYLFISLFRACAKSVASENASRLAAMERADRNIRDLLEDLHGSFHRLRQGSIDEELFDVTAGYEALAQP